MPDLLDAEELDEETEPSCERCGHCEQCDYWHDDMGTEYHAESGCDICFESHQEDCSYCGCGICGYTCGDCGDCNPEDYYDGGEAPTRHLVLDPVHGNITHADFLTHRRTVGVELELERDNYRTSYESIAALVAYLDEQDRGVGVGYDGSLKDYPAGIELRFPPGYGKAYEDLLTRVTNKAAALGYEATAATGLHVHVSIQDYGTPDQWKLYALVGAAQKGLYALQPHRRKAQWCEPLPAVYRDSCDHRVRLSEQSQRTATLKPGRLLAYLDQSRSGRTRFQYGANAGKYRIANIGTEYGTVEFRLFEATTKPDVIGAWAGLCQAMVDTVPRLTHKELKTAVLDLDNAREDGMVLRTLYDVVGANKSVRKVMNKTYAKGKRAFGIHKAIEKKPLP